ncbi:hypothetical protein V0M98_32025 (plasmid) [Pseudomonas silesiensis]|uniref:hypothetical protein n=1 Tax=Pseudomonas silesiensis TaxID=1853130 RepID=UPI0030CA5BAD
MTDQLLNNVETSTLMGLSGFLVIGDPWLGSPRRVGRADDPWEASFSKLEQAIKLAKEKNLLPIIVGDMLHETRDIGQLLPIINLLSGARALLMPHSTRWQESSIAAILKAAGIVQVVGASANRFQLKISREGKTSNMMLESFTSWGGHERLEPGCSAYLNVADMKLKIMQSRQIPMMEGDETGNRIIAGRLLRLTPVEEQMVINVYAVTLDGVEEIPLSVLPKVFSSVDAQAHAQHLDLQRDSVFVDNLRKAAAESAEEEGKGSLITFIDSLCDELKYDDWMRGTMLELAKTVVTQDAQLA